MCSSMKQPKPERLVEILGMPITVHSAAGRREKGGPLSFCLCSLLHRNKAPTAPSTDTLSKSLSPQNQAVH